MKWSDEYATGIERIDKQHQTLFRMASDFGVALDEGGGRATYGQLLEFLDAYCRGHFGFEEECMEQYSCPVAEQNREAHSTFLATVGDFQQRYAASGYLAADARELVATIEEWLASHICGIDIHLRDCVTH